MNRIERTLMYKDIREITGSKQIYVPMIIVPIIMMVIIPTVLVVASHFGGKGIGAINGLDRLIENLPKEYKELPQGQLILKSALNFMFPALFLIIPIMLSSMLGASSFVGEKEHKTMETLLYTPITMEQLLKAKILSIFIPSYVITLVSYILFGIVINIGGFLQFNRITFPDIKWIIIILWLTPAITLFSLTFTALISAKSKSFQEAQQIGGLLVLPVLFLIVGQTTGLFLLNNMMVVVAGAILFILDYVLVNMISKKFTAEKLI